MTKATSFVVTPRTELGKKLHPLRKARFVPGNIIQKHEPSVTISCGQSDLNRLYHQVGDTGVVYLQITGESATRPVLFEDVQRHPMTNELLHVVFKQVDLSKKVTAEIPVLLIGESNVPNTVLVTVHDKIEVEALPTDLPEKFEVSVEGLTEVGKSVTFADLQFDRSKITLMIEEEELNTPIVLLQEVKEEPVEVPVETPEEAAAPAAEATTTETPAAKPDESSPAAKTE